MAKQPRETRPEAGVPAKRAEPAPHPLGAGGDKPTEITDEDYWARGRGSITTCSLCTTQCTRSRTA